MSTKPKTVPQPSYGVGAMLAAVGVNQKTTETLAFEGATLLAAGYIAMKTSQQIPLTRYLGEAGAPLYLAVVGTAGLFVADRVKAMLGWDF